MAYWPQDPILLYGKAHRAGGGILQEAHVGFDYIKVNFHTDNFTIIDKVIDVFVPLSEIDHTLHGELCGLRTDVYSFLSYGYAGHEKLGVKASDDTQDQIRQPQEHNAQQFDAYDKLETLVSEPDAFDEPVLEIELVIVYYVIAYTRD